MVIFKSNNIGDKSLDNLIWVIFVTEIHFLNKEIFLFCSDNLVNFGNCLFQYMGLYTCYHNFHSLKKLYKKNGPFISISSANSYLKLKNLMYPFFSKWLLLNLVKNYVAILFYFISLLFPFIKQTFFMIT